MNGGRSFEPNPQSSIPPFQLLLVGSQYLGVPDELEHVVTIYRDLPYKGFYDIVANCDIVLPAFADNSCECSPNDDASVEVEPIPLMNRDTRTDYKIRASSTIALATELNVPMLVTSRTRHTYGFIDDDRIVVTRPAMMSEVQALRALRTGDAAPFLAARVADAGMTAGEMPAVRAGVERMMKEGWAKPARGWDEWREGMWSRNRDVADKMLRDIP